ncbi:MAG: MFS transporter, partial [Pseudomonadota bacterium]
MTIAQLTSTDRARKSAKPLVVLAATILGSATVFIDTAVMTIALPVVQTEFEADLAELQWITEAYLLTLTALMLTGGALGDQLGRRRIFLIGMVLFAAASLWCGLSRGVGELLIARAGQGIGGALLVPGSLAILTHYFPKGERGRAIGIWSAFTSISVAFAPLLGGWMIDTLSWRWIFFINVPLGV